MTHEDSFTLGSQTFYSAGPIRANSVAEWTTGLKVGSATYDERSHAFYLVLDDFSGGIGYRRLDIREALGTVWDNPGGVDLRRTRHVTLPPLQSVAAVTAPTALDYTKRQPSVPILGTDVTALSHIIGFGGNLYRSTDGGDTLSSVKVISNAYMVAKILEFAESPIGTTTLFAFPEGTGGAAKYQKSTDGTTWSDGGAYATQVVEDAIVWAQRLVGTVPIARIVYSFDGLEWSNDTTGPTFDAVDYIWAANYGRVQFIGVSMAPWGEPAIHFLARNDAGLQALFVLDFFARTAYEIPIGNKRHLHDAFVWSEYIVITDAYNVWLYDGSTVRNIGWPKKGGGLPPSLAGAIIVKLIGGTDTLFAVLYTAAGGTQVIAYNGAGWSQLGPEVSSFKAVVAGIVSKWVPATVATERRILLAGSAGFGSAVTPRRMTLRLPDTGEVPVVGTDNFSAGPAAFRTGWINGGFEDIKGALYSLKCDAFSLTASETITVGYRLDNNEAAVFTTLGIFTGVGQVLKFASPTGLEFRTIQFEVTLVRGGTANLSPELVSLVLTYDKKPELRTTWTLRIDVDRMKQDQVLVDGNAATTARIWTKMKALWNTKTLLAFTVPNVETGTLYVKIADMPMTLDDFRTAVKGQGYVEIQVLEPITSP